MYAKNRDQTITCISYELCFCFIFLTKFHFYGCETQGYLVVRAIIAVYGSICEQIRNKGFSTGMCCS